MTRKKPFFYLDPPYYGHEDYYGKKIFTKNDYSLLAEQLKTIKGKCLLSINDADEIKDIFSDFYIDTIEHFYTFNGPKNVTELLISNFEINPRAQASMGF